MKAMMKRKNYKITSLENELSIYYFDKTPKSQYYIEIDNSKKTKYELKIQLNPFKITYLINNKIVIEMNSKNLMHMEIPYDFTKTEVEAMSTVMMDVVYNDCQFLTGLPERAGSPFLSDTNGDDLYRLYNIDYFKYNKDQQLGLYGAWPFILSNSLEGSVYTGFIWNNPSETYVKVNSVDNNKEVFWISESGIMDFSFLSDANIFNFYFKYHRYIGFPTLPPAFSLGYHQSRWNYKDTNDAINVDKYFDEFGIPYDSLWLDIEVILYIIYDIAYR